MRAPGGRPHSIYCSSRWHMLSACMPVSSCRQSSQSNLHEPPRPPSQSTLGTEAVVHRSNDPQQGHSPSPHRCSIIFCHLSTEKSPSPCWRPETATAFFLFLQNVAARSKQIRRFVRRITCNKVCGDGEVVCRVPRPALRRRCVSSFPWKSPLLMSVPQAFLDDIVTSPR